MNNKKKGSILKTLDYLTLFYINVNYTNSPDEYVKIYNRNLTYLKEISKNKSYLSLVNIIEKYPIISSIEIQKYIDYKNGNENITSVISGDFWSQLLNLLGSRKNIFEEPFENKLKQIVDLNDKVKNILTFE